MTNRLHVGIDFSQKQADFCLLLPNGQPLELHQAFANSYPGYSSAKQLLLDALHSHQFEGVNLAGEATSYYWLPFFLQLAADPDLEPHDVQLFLLNPRWVSWFKKCFAQDDKSDQKDSYYIAERTRTHCPQVAWSPLMDTLPLRFYTRLRFHLVHTLAREKCYLSAFLFLRASAYRRLKPFSDVFGATSRLILTQWPSLDQLADLPVESLTSYLHELSGHHLHDPAHNALTLQRVARESFPLAPVLALPVQRILDLTLAHIRFLEDQIQLVEDWITAELPSHPAIPQLATIPGLGPVFSSGIVAEIGNTQRFLQHPKWDKQRKCFRTRNLRDAEDAVAKIAGLWWPRSDSGDFEAEDRRMAKTGNRYLRYYFIQAADRMRTHIPAYAAFYARKYQEVSKHKHKRALVLTARKSVGLVIGLLHRNEPYRSQEDCPH
ncbi:MAG: transposase [Anaerolineae bacterium]|nr:transposase [Anaerolineae bacterium]